MFDAERWNEIDDSSLIRALGVKEGWLIVQFHQGSVYRYARAAHHMDELLASESLGKYFHANVKELGGQRLTTDGEWPELD